MRLIKRITNKAFTTAIIIALIFALILSAFSFRLFASADDEKIDDTKEFTATSLGVSNTNFSDSSGGYDPTASPSSWTGASVGGGNGGTGIIAGVVDLTPSNYLTAKCGNKGLFLDQYPEYSEENVIPKTIFGSTVNGVKYDGDKKTLIINTKPEQVVSYAFSSTDMSFSPNSFYRVSAWVKTGDFSVGGATIKLTGLGENCSFTNINTVKDLAVGDYDKPEYKYGWVQYRFYVRTSASLTKTVKLSLGIGDAKSSEDDGELLPGTGPAHGYAFFDSIEAHRISSYDFAYETNAFTPSDRDNVYYNGNQTAMVLDLYEPEYLTTTVDEETVEIGTFSNATLGANGYWNPNISYYDNEDDDDVGFVKSASVDIYDASLPIDFDDESVKFTKSPWTPLGRAEFASGNEYFNGGDNGNILRIAANNGAATRGVASPDVTIERFKHYRMSVWVKGDKVTGGDGISVLIKGEDNIPADKYVLHSAHTSLGGDASDAAHYGWKEQVFYIQGSSQSDCTIHFEFWLGSPNNPSEGIALFDNVTFTELSQSDYNELGAADGGAVISLDPASSDTGVTNGNFISLGEYDEISFPMPVADWTFYDASNVGTAGFATDDVNTDNAIHGMIPADTETFDAIRSNGKLGTVSDPSKFALPPKYNALLLSSTTETAICYRSPSVTAAVDKGYKLTVDMAVDGVTSGYGASLVLKTTEGSVLSTIEGIKNTGNKYKTFTFYIDAPLSEHSVYVEIWLGLNDRINNTKKLSNGNVYVKQVAMTEWTAADGSTVAQEYASYLEDYKQIVSNTDRLKNLDYGVVSFDSPSLDYFDAYSYNMPDGVVLPYGWTISSSESGMTSKIYDSDNRKGEVLYDGFDSKDESGRMLYVYNTANNRTVCTFNNTVALVSNTYYRLDVTLKVRVSDEIRKDKTSIGAGINLTGTVNTSFENIKDTTTLVSQGNEASRDYETFKTYTFYISTGASGGNVGLNISFGGTSRKNYIQGKLVISDVSLKSMTESDYEEAIGTLNSREKKVELSAESADNGDDNTEKPQSEISWWLIPTIIFSVCLIAAIAIIIVIRVRDHFKKKKKTTYTSEYDRASVAKKLDRLANGDDDLPTEDKPEKYVDTDDGEVVTDTPETEEPVEEAPVETEKAEKPEKKSSADDLDD